MIKRYIPLKYKLILVFGQISAVILLGYFFLAVKLFEQDKVAYVYSSALESIENKRVLISDFINFNAEKLDDVSSMLNAGNINVVRDYLNAHTEIKKFKSFTSNFDWGDASVDQTNKIQESSDYQLNLIDHQLVLNRHKDNKLIYSAVIDAKIILEDENGHHSFFIMASGPLRGRDKNLVQNFRNKIIKARLQSGVKEIEGELGPYLVAYNKILPDLYLVRAIPKEIALLGVEDLKIKSFFYLIGLIALASILSIFMGNYFINPINELIESTELLGEGKFQTRAKVLRNDELGKLARVFNIMAEKISALIAEVESYSKHLEELVAQKTSSLTKALSLQKAMINSLDQGFFLVNNKLKILGEYSKSAKLFFGPTLEGKDVDQVIVGPDLDKEFLRPFFENLFLEKIPFESLLPLAPKQYETFDHRTLVLDYEPIRNESGKLVVVVVISTDITDRLKVEKENERQKSHVQMILRILNGQYQFTRLLQETKASFDDFLLHEDTKFTYDNLLRLAHSLKGNFGIYYLIDLVHEIHDIEKKIISAIDPAQLMECFHLLLNTVDTELTKLSQEYPFLTNGKDWKNTHNSYVYEESEIKRVIESVNQAHNLVEVKEILRDQLLKLPIKQLFSSLIEDCLEHSKKVGKPIDDIEIIGGELRVEPAFCSLLIQHLIHLTRNCVDHGLERPEQRIEKAKTESGHICISFSKTSDQKMLISIKDDGRGIDSERLLEKAREAGLDMSRFNAENAWEIIFESGISTAQEESLTSGRGIGMFDVQNFIRENGGEIKVISIPDKGCEFLISLPAF